MITVAVSIAHLSLTAHEFQHLAVCARLNAAGIDEREAPSVPVALAVDPVARHARRVLDNRHALAGQFIKQHRFADIRPAYDCYNRFCHRYYLPLTQKQPLRRGRCPRSTRRYKSFLRKSSANSFVPLGRCGHRPLRSTWRIHAATWAFSLLTPSLSSHKQQNKKRGRLRTTSLSFSYRANLLSFNRNDFTAIVIAASLAGSVRQAAGSPHLGQATTPRITSFQWELRLLSLLARDTFLLGTAIWYTSLVEMPLGHIVYFLSNNCCKAAKRGSGSGLQPQGPRFRFAPHREQSPLQSSLHRSLLSMFSTKVVVTMSSRSAQSF